MRTLGRRIDDVERAARAAVPQPCPQCGESAKVACPVSREFKATDEFEAWKAAGRPGGDCALGLLRKKCIVGITELDLMINPADVEVVKLGNHCFLYKPKRPGGGN
jgi:hypothetical protein